MEIIVFSVSWFLIGMFVGGYMVRRHMIDYKERWQQAVKLLEGADAPRERTILLKPDPKKGQFRERPPETRMPMDKIHQMSNSARVQIELNRLNAGLPPRDDLVGLSNSAVTQIETARTRKGWS